METTREFSSVVQLPQFPGASVVTRSNAPEDPHQATAATIDRMKSLAQQDANSAQVMGATRQALMLSGASEYERSCAIFHWICSHVKFREDDPVLRIVLGLENELEMLIAPARLLTMHPPAGDCDCLTTLCMSMHLCAGIPIEPLTIKADREDPDRDSHVYCQSVLENGNLVLDPAQGAKHGWQPGDEAPGWFQKDEWGVVMPQQRRGLNGLGQSGEVDVEGGLLPTDVISTTLPSGTGFDINSLLKQITAGGLSIAKMVATPVGYVQTPTMTANYGAGGQIPLSFGSSLGGISPILLIGGGLLAVMLFSRK